MVPVTFTASPVGDLQEDAVIIGTDWLYVMSYPAGCGADGLIPFIILMISVSVTVLRILTVYDGVCVCVCVSELGDPPVSQ